MAVASEKANVEVSLGVSVHRIWSAAKKIEVLMPKVLPDVFSSCDVDGDGGLGTIRVYHCGPAIQEGLKIRERIDEIDEDIHSLSYCIRRRPPVQVHEGKHKIFPERGRCHFNCGFQG